tara:strand:- start:2141 stop:2584 length:444 start_codon:yes stop_codon:yes gene_type:complete
MDVILLIDYDSLGKAGDIVKVKPGFARNMLIPKGIALRASSRNLAIAKQQKQITEMRIERERSQFEQLAKKISNIEITIEVQVGDEDKMFGSITNQDIQKSLKDKGVDVERGAIVLDEPIKSLGIYHVKIKISPEVNGDVKIYVIKA